MKIPKRVVEYVADYIAQGERTIISHGFVDFQRSMMSPKI